MLKPVVLLCLMALAASVTAESLEAECEKGLVCFDTWWQHGRLVLVPWLMVFIGSPVAIVSLMFLVLGKQRGANPPASQQLSLSVTRILVNVSTIPNTNTTML